jgi:hypothetical protein
VRFEETYFQIPNGCGDMLGKVPSGSPAFLLAYLFIPWISHHHIAKEETLW